MLICDLDPEFLFFKIDTVGARLLAESCRYREEILFLPASSSSNTTFLGGEMYNLLWLLPFLMGPEFRFWYLPIFFFSEESPYSNIDPSWIVSSSIEKSTIEDSEICTSSINTYEPEFLERRLPEFLCWECRRCFLSVIFFLSFRIYSFSDWRIYLKLFELF